MFNIYDKVNSHGQRNQTTTCKYHPEAYLIEECRAGDQICSECGMVVGDRVIDVGSEWRTFSGSDKPNEDRSRVGDSENSSKSATGLSTIIGPITKGMAAMAVNGDVGAPKHTRTHNKMSNFDRTLANGIKEIGEMADKIHIPKTVVDMAQDLFKKVHEAQCLKGRSTHAITAACLYISCRQGGVARTFKEICSVSWVGKKEITRCFKKILLIFEDSLEFDIIKTDDFMSRFCGNLNLPNSVLKAATHIALKAVELHIVSGRSPVSVAAASIYMASHTSESMHKRTQKQIADIAGVADVTIRQCYKLLFSQYCKVKSGEQSGQNNLLPSDLSVPIGQLPTE